MVEASPAVVASQVEALAVAVASPEVAAVAVAVAAAEDAKTLTINN